MEQLHDLKLPTGTWNAILDAREGLRTRGGDKVYIKGEIVEKIEEKKSMRDAKYVLSRRNEGYGYPRSHIFERRSPLRR